MKWKGNVTIWKDGNKTDDFNLNHYCTDDDIAQVIDFYTDEKNVSIIKEFSNLVTKVKYYSADELTFANLLVILKNETTKIEFFFVRNIPL